MANFSVYPEAIDGYATLPLVRNQIDEIRAEVPNRLRDAIVKIEQELGIQPSGTFATVRARLDEIGDVRALHLAHLADPEDAHDASAISVLDTVDNYFEDDVEGVLAELGSLVPPRPDAVGADNSKVPNDGIPSWFDGYGTRFVFNTSSGDNVVKRTQPSAAVGVRGIHIIEVSGTTDPGTGAKLKMAGGVGTEVLTWAAPGESDGATVDISGLDAGDVATITSGGDTTKRIRVARTSEPLRVPPKEDTFDVYGLDAVTGFYSLPSVGFKETKFITRTATDASGVSRLQAMVQGTMFPADRGTIVLQRKLRGASDFFPIAVLNVKNIFNEAIRTAGQVVYTPSLENFDTVLLFDRVPVSEDYSLFNKSADNTNIYEDYENDFGRLQIAKYLIPLSNPDIVGGTLTSPEGITETDANDDVSAYRVVHYTTEDTSANFSGEPLSTEVFSVLETSVPDFNEDPQNFTRIVNFYADNSATRPGVEHVNLIPVRRDINDAHNPLSTAFIKFVSGIPYYTAERQTTATTGTPEGDPDSVSDNNKFEIELRSDNNVFNKTYLREDTLTFETNVFNFRHGTADGKFGAQVDVAELLDDGYAKYSASNLPDHSDQAFYFAKDAGDVAVGIPSIDTRLIPVPDTFSTRAFIKATLHDPFGPGDGYDAYGVDFVNRILVNSFGTDRSTNSTDWFTDETFRIADAHEFLGPTDAYAPPAFDSTATLTSGSLQCGGRFVADEAHIPGLIYPQDDYTVGNGIVPNNSSTTRDYSALTGDRTYRRTLTLGYAISGGKLRIKSDGNSLVSFEDIRFKEGNERDRFGKVEVKIPGFGPNSTEWLDVGRLFRTGHYENGDGALAGGVTGTAGDFTVPFTFGPRNSGDTENKIAVKITYYGQHEEERAVSQQKIMTLLQLLP